MESIVAIAHRQHSAPRRNGSIRRNSPVRENGSIRENKLTLQTNSKGKRLLNKTEMFYFKVVSSALRDFCPYRLGVLPQVPLSQITDINQCEKLTPSEKARAFSLVCDFVIFNSDLYPVLAIEVNGKGHYQNNWKERDTLKAEVLKQAGIPLKVIFPDEWPRNFAESKAKFGRLLRSLVG
ncbi:MAG: DUF2726 domain-containing protein [Candidatus Desulfofervidaceae bacterium]|nr:DUF2726 domain-containing protein [Candidatus Desulfofervidaceae bacterium]